MNSHSGGIHSSWVKFITGRMNFIGRDTEKDQTHIFVNMTEEIESK